MGCFFEFGSSWLWLNRCFIIIVITVLAFSFSFSFFICSCFLFVLIHPQYVFVLSKVKYIVLLQQKYKRKNKIYSSKRKSTGFSFLELLNLQFLFITNFYQCIYIYFL